MIEFLEDWHKDKPKVENFNSVSKAVKLWLDNNPSQSSNLEYLRVSGLHGLCPREQVIHYWRPRPNKSFDALSILKMNMGTLFHHYMQNYILGPMQLLYGTWVKEGEYEDEIAKGFHPDPNLTLWESVRQHELTWKFREETVKDDTYRLIGHHDGEISKDRLKWMNENVKLIKTDFKKACEEVSKIPAGTLALLEMKSTGSFAYEKITEIDSKCIPDYYQMQASTYLWLKKLENTLFLFIDRDTFAMKCVDYVYKPGWVIEAKRKARIIWESIRDEVLPESMMACGTSMDKRAKSCIHADVCWKKGLDFKTFIAECKLSQPDRKWLDLKDVKFD